MLKKSVKNARNKNFCGVHPPSPQFHHPHEFENFYLLIPSPFLLKGPDTPYS